MTIPKDREDPPHHHTHSPSLCGTAAVGKTTRSDEAEASGGEPQQTCCGGTNSQSLRRLHFVCCLALTACVFAGERISEGRKGREAGGVTAGEMKAPAMEDDAEGEERGRRGGRLL